MALFRIERADGRVERIEAHGAYMLSGCLALYQGDGDGAMSPEYVAIYMAGTVASVVRMDALEG